MDEIKINVTRSSMPPLEEYVEEITPLWESRWLSNHGVIAQKLEEEIKARLDVVDVCTFVNGHMALEVAIQSLFLPRGAEVITTPYTHISTTHAITRNGLTPVFVDIEPVHYTLDPDRIEEAVTEKTAAIVATHVYGFPCDVKRIEAIAKKYGLVVIYDAAHAFNVKYKEIGIGNFGDYSMFSCHATKVFHTIEGGLITCKPEHASEMRRIRQIANFGNVSEDDISYVGPNAKMNEFAAAMGICNLRHLDEMIALRRAADTRYCERLMDVPGIHVPRPSAETEWNCIYFPVVFDGVHFNRDTVKAKLDAHGIYARKYFYPLTNMANCYASQYGAADLPVAREVSQNVLTLPMFSDLTPEMVDEICDVILKED